MSVAVALVCLAAFILLLWAFLACISCIGGCEAPDLGGSDDAMREDG